MGRTWSHFDPTKNQHRPNISLSLAEKITTTTKKTTSRRRRYRRSLCCGWSISARGEWLRLFQSRHLSVSRFWDSSNWSATGNDLRHFAGVNQVHLKEADTPPTCTVRHWLTQTFSALPDERSSIAVFATPLLNPLPARSSSSAGLVVNRVKLLDAAEQIH